ncbi:flagellar hook-associated protein FlgL [Aeromonas simiae]|uniref:Flagellar hook-associated protein 3 n=1 Tax=Aeromonas simiae TaxID=218936 RepID=A0A5J6WSW1_9GAMM|nr:flagellar hook-associated protein FlgL [Aeromonas simiae]QFI54229.1 flagellar hook-associated protein 3 [Aeromonas simiae]
MRITTNMIYNRSLTALSGANERLDRANNQLITGQAFTSAGENPSGMGQKMALDKEIALYQQYNVNGSLLENGLSHEETILSSIHDAMLSAQTLVQKANDGALDAANRASIASELEGVQKQLFDLMNSKNSQGEYMFGGNQSEVQPFVQDAAGNYLFQGDTGVRFLQVSPSVNLQANDSGLDLFQTVATRRSASATSANIQVGVADQGQFDTFYKSSYDPALPSNSFSVNTIAGSPDTYEVYDSGGTLLQSGDYVAGNTINFQGLSLTLSVPAGGASQSFALDTPTNDNVLNSLGSFITTLRDPTVTGSNFQDAVADVSVHLENSRRRMDLGMGNIGARLNSLELVMSSNSGLDIMNKETRANVSEADMYETISTIAKEETVLSASQLAFSKIGQLSLFDYIR